MDTYYHGIQDEAEWLSCSDVRRMWDSVKCCMTERKTWLFAFACCRQLPGYLESEADRLVLEAAERHLEGGDGLQEMLDHFDNTKWDIRFHRLNAREAVCRAIEAIWVKYEGDVLAWARYADILRDIFGNPFRPVQLDRAWLTPKVVALARNIYRWRAFHLMDALAKAMEECECNHGDMISHCRQQVHHVRGCWVVDLLLGKDGGERDLKRGRS